MGWMSAATITNYVIVEGANDGVFVYNGTPAAGNLIASTASSAGTDPYGNTYLSAVTSYYHGVSSWFALQHSAAEMIWYTASTYAGPWTQDSLIEVSAAGQMLLQAGVTQFYLDSTPYITAPLSALDPVTQSAPEGWHPFTPSSGFANVAGYAPAAYRLNALGNVEMAGRVTGTISGNTTITTLPSGYYSTAYARSYPANVDSAAGGLTPSETPHLHCSTSGVVYITGLANGSATIDLDGMFMLSAG